jgi:transcriptional regulator with XRE-family HTH domain
MLHGLRRARISKGLSQQELSEKSGVHRDTIHKLESGQRPARPATIKRLANALAVKTEELTDEGIPRMAEGKTMMVPAFYPDSKDADTWRRWDGSEEARLWRTLLDFRESAMVESAARLTHELGEDADLSGLLANLWIGLSTLDPEHEEAKAFVERHRGTIERRARKWEG